MAFTSQKRIVECKGYDMNSLSYKGTLERLCRSGLTGRAIRWLQQFDRLYTAGVVEQSPLDQRRLEFARWLVATHRLTDQITLNNDIRE
jgi:hypothetical protein